MLRSKMDERSLLLLLWGSAVLMAGVATAEERLPALYWGDTHVHSAYSLDANLFNNFRLGPDAAYRFARGETVEVSPGVRAKLDRPLDFLVVSDHAEYLGVISMIRSGNPIVEGSETARKVRQLIDEYPIFGPESIGKLNELLAGDPLGADEEIQRYVWDDVIDIAERANEPGRFTALVGYEWGTTPNGNNLHRNVVFRDGPDRAGQILPFSAIHSNHPEELWAFLADYEAKTGGQAFAIPHNSNLSNGLMFAVEDSWGEPIDAEHARMRVVYEPVVEVTQIKGDSETHPFLSPDDEFADYETWDKTNIFGIAKTEKSMLASSYVRSTLMNGLEIQARIGENPFKFGLIGSTDAHTSLATADDDNFWGKTANMPPGSRRMEGPFIQSLDPNAPSTMNWEQAAAGYVGVWAADNTREAIFDAMRRKEVYSTTGARMTLRFFGGWHFEKGDATAADLARRGYAGGVPMGGDLPKAGPGAAGPSFLLAVSRDPRGANLQRVQIVKGWLDESGQARERVIDVVVAEDELKGLAEVVTVWQDPDFDPSALAFYYVRALEVPTPRWNAIDATRYATPIAGQRVINQERIYSSPIWYVP